MKINLRFLAVGKLGHVFKRLIFFVSGHNIRVKLLRLYGVKIGHSCIIYSHQFSTEPYLIELGNNVAISARTEFITHDGSVQIFRDKYPGLDIFGKISVGDNSFIGIGCLILPNTRIGSNCIIGAGSVVRGEIPDNSVVIGNPAKIIYKTSVMEKLIKFNKNGLYTKDIKKSEKETIIKGHFNL